MLDIIESTRTLTGAGLEPGQAAAIAHVVQQAVEQGDHVTPDQFRAGIAEVRAEMAEVRTEIANLDTRLSTQMAEMRAEMAEQRTEQRTGIANLDTRLSTQMAEMRTEMARSETRLIRWVGGIMLTAAGIVTAAVVATGLAILRAMAAG